MFYNFISWYARKTNTWLKSFLFIFYLFIYYETRMHSTYIKSKKKLTSSTANTVNDTL